MENRYTGSSPPPKSAKIDIVRVTTSETRMFVICSKSIFGQNIHWYGNRSHECTREKSECNGCKRGWPEKWLGYVYVQEMEREDLVFLELTKTACEKLWAQIDAGKNLRGVQVRISKTKGGAKGRYLINVLERRIPDETLPGEKDPVEILRFLWRCKNQHSQNPPA